MTSHLLDQQPIRLNLDEDQIEAITWLMDDLTLSLKGVHCGPVRQFLDWSIDDLSSASGVTTQAIVRLERDTPLNAVSMQALGFALEEEGLVFFPGHLLLRGKDCQGSMKDPRSRRDYHLLE
ncbi:XRE family transcriptional regulator [Pseudomonas monteilii]|uniref:XRE family transcriptional regulator n=1 Tax=Pseudomonas monteilii TaxID=76759 RepID=UPI003D989C75